MMSNQYMTVQRNKRDRFSLTRSQLLQDYLKIMKRRPGAAAATAIRVRSHQFYDLLAADATFGEMNWEQLRSMLAWSIAQGGDRLLRETFFGKKRVVEIDPGAVAEMARVLVLHPIDESDRYFGSKLLTEVIDYLPKTSKTRNLRSLLVQLCLTNGEDQQALSYLDRWKDVDKIEHQYLRGEILNPFVKVTGGDKTTSIGGQAEWLENFNRSFVADGFAPISLAGDAPDVFDRITTAAVKADPTGQYSGDPLVSVVFTTFQPTRFELLTSVRSILNQTVSNIEVLIVDDASGDEYSQLLDEIEDIDSRVRVIRLSENGGTYVARNIGFGQARGEFVTGQDDDDWSHPQRLETQVRYLQENENVVGCRISAITCLPNLSRTRLGYRPANSNASSLMVSKKVMDQSGGFLPIRKAADTELARRIERIHGKKIEDLAYRLSIVRVDPDSLSRSEFGAGWSHPARNQFKSSYLLWQKNATKNELRLQGKKPSVAIPRRFQRIASETSGYDVVLAGDWRKYGGPQKSMIEEINALVSRGLKVAILHLEAARFMTKTVDPLNDHIQDLINDGVVDEVLYDDEVHVKLLILRYPPILQFAPYQSSNLDVARMLITANQAPSELDGSDVRYIVEDCHKNAEFMFDTEVSWVPQGPQVREAIAPYLDETRLMPFNFPGILNPSEWETAIPRKPVGNLPVIGRHSRDDDMKWPEDNRTLKAVYPISNDVKVRIMGGGNTPLKVLGQDGVPGNWEVLVRDKEPVQKFLNTLDFFVFYQHSEAVEAFGRSILEAIATNLVVILPPHYEPVFGQAAVYAYPEDVRDTVNYFYSDWSRYVQQQKRADEVLRREFVYDSFYDRVDELLEGLIPTRAN